MATAAKGGFPGCPKRKIEKQKVRKFNSNFRGQRWGHTLSICDQIKKNLRGFYEIFGDSEEEEDFHGFSSEECGLRAYKRISGNGHSSVEIRIPDILCSPIDLNKKKVTTRLAHARNSIEALPSSQRTRRRKKTIIRKRYSKSEVRIVEGNDVPTEPLMRVTSSESEYRTASPDHGFTKYKNSQLDFHRLSKSMGFKSHSSRDQSSSIALKPPRTSPIKPATFIAPSLTQQPHHVTNITPTCLKIKINAKDSAGPGHPKILAKALLARASKKNKRGKNWDQDGPMCTSTPINAAPTKTKSKLFVMPTKSSRSSRIIKVNRRYIDNYSNNEEDSKFTENSQESISNPETPPIKQVSKSYSESSYESPSKSRPLLKEATFRVAALANINNKPLPSRISNKEKAISNRIRARKLIKRARFKHPTSSSTLVVGNDFEDESQKKKNLIREATFKAPNHGSQNSSSDSGRDELPDLGMSLTQWDKVIKNDLRMNSPQWTKQEIHNVLHGANTFSNSWSSVARHYAYHPSHRDWSSIRCKAQSLKAMGILSNSLKVKSSILLQLRPRYSDNPNVMVFTPRELRARGLERNLEWEVGPGGRMKRNGYGELLNIMKEGKKTSLEHKKVFKSWKEMIDYSEPDKADAKSIYLGLSKEGFSKMCEPRGRNNTVKFNPWSVREIHNVLHGIHVFGVGDWNKMHEMYEFDPTHDNIGIRARFKSVVCKGLVVAGKLKPGILPLLQPKFSMKGKSYFELDGKQKKKMEEKRKSSRMRRTSKENSDDNQAQTNNNQHSNSSDNDMTSPPRKQTYHLFGTAPVWDDRGTATGLKTLEDNLEVGDAAPESAEAVSELPEAKEVLEELKQERRVSSDSHFARKSKKQVKEEVGEVKIKMKPSGPRIKHVCRRASLVTGQKLASYEDCKNPRLSALPKEEREKIASEVERLRGLMSSTSSDSELDIPVTIAKKPQQAAVRKDRSKKMREGRRCNTCKSCRSTKCGDCDNCRNPLYANTNKCMRRPSCMNLVLHGNGALNRDANLDRKMKAPAFSETRISNKPSFDTATQRSLHTANTGIILSPDSRYQLRKELHEKDMKLPSIVKIDEWKERYEVEDLWKVGGVSLITSMTPSTQYLCFLCGSVGKSRPARRISVNSDTSTCTDKSDMICVPPLFIFCSSCCEPFHPFCLDDHEQQISIAAAKKGFWICRRCRFCNVCGRPDNLLECKRCNKTYHSACLGPSYPTKPSQNQVWVCMRCVRCRSCGASKPGRPGSKWTHDFQLCQRCGDLFDKGNFCPICRRCYRDEDYDSRMVQCGTCKRWVHSRCESLTVEMYTLLSHLPDDVQYVCPDCDGRRSKVELDLNHSDSILTDESSSDSIEGDKMRDLLCRLPSPSWKKMIEEEIQTGIENVTMALFHNREAACILKTSSIQEDGDRPTDLFTVRFAVHNRRYTSVAQFSTDVCAILDTVTGEDMQTDTFQGDEPFDKRMKRKRNNTEARGAFCQEMHNVFPWFDVDTGRVRDSSDVPDDMLPNATLPPHMDHIYAQWQDRDINVAPGGPDTPMKNFAGFTPTKADEIGLVVWDSVSPKNHYDDMRQCLFCGKYGDDKAMNAGRLLYCGQDEWVHVNCALWSAEVFERHDGSLQNVHSAVSRGRMMKCELCKLPGATVGCNTRDCPQNYHFSCARLANCAFQDDKKVFCFRHARYSRGEVVTDEGFEVGRRVVVDNDEMRPNKRWQRGVHSHDVTILMGSATVHQLGHLALSSDSRDYLIPVHFRMTRIFWSTLHAGRRVRYTITVAEQRPSVDSDSSLGGLGSPREGRMNHHGNHTISHAEEEKTAFMSTMKKPSYPGADACRSKLIDRFTPAPLPASRRKSHEHNYVEQNPNRSRRLSGSSYTVIAGINRTLPQAITPMPTISRSPGNYTRLLPTISSQVDETTETLEKKSNNNQNVVSHDSGNISPSKRKSTLPSFDGTKVSPDNPFLNIPIKLMDSGGTPIEQYTNAPPTGAPSEEKPKFLPVTKSSDKTGDVPMFDATTTHNEPNHVDRMASGSGMTETQGQSSTATPMTQGTSTSSNIDEKYTHKEPPIPNINLGSSGAILTQPLPQTVLLDPETRSPSGFQGVIIDPCTAPLEIPTIKTPTNDQYEVKTELNILSTTDVVASKEPILLNGPIGKSECISKVSLSDIDCKSILAPNEPQEQVGQDATSSTETMERALLSLKSENQEMNEVPYVKEEVGEKCYVQGGEENLQDTVNVKEEAIIAIPDTSEHPPGDICDQYSDVNSKLLEDKKEDEKMNVDPESPAIPPIKMDLLKGARNAIERESSDDQSKNLAESVESASLWWKRDPKSSGTRFPASRLSFQRRRCQRKFRKDSDEEQYDPLMDGEKHPYWRRNPRESLSSEEDMKTSINKIKTRSSKKLEEENIEQNYSEDAHINTRRKKLEDEKEKMTESQDSNSNDEDGTVSKMRTRSKKFMINDDLAGASEPEEKSMTQNMEESQRSSSPPGVTSIPNKKSKSVSGQSVLDISSSNSSSITDESLNKDPKSVDEARGRSPSNTRIKSLRKFARDSSESEMETKMKKTDSPVNNESPKVNEIRENVSGQDMKQEVEDLSENFKSPQMKRRKTRSFSQDSTPVVALRKKRTRNSSTRSAGENSDPAESPENLRKRSKSVEGGSKKNKKPNSFVRKKNKLGMLEINFSPRRYPRRNTLTCLKSFSGLSPSYAIQSYATMNQDRQERANARSFKNDLKSSAKKHGSDSNSKGRGKSVPLIDPVPTQDKIVEPEVVQTASEAKVQDDLTKETTVDDQTEKVVDDSADSDLGRLDNEEEDVPPPGTDGPKAVLPEHNTLDSLELIPPTSVTNSMEKVIPCSIVLSSCEPQTESSMSGSSVQSTVSPPATETLQGKDCPETSHAVENPVICNGLPENKEIEEREKEELCSESRDSANILDTITDFSTKTKEEELAAGESIEESRADAEIKDSLDFLESSASTVNDISQDDSIEIMRGIVEGEKLLGKNITPGIDNDVHLTPEKLAQEDMDVSALTPIPNSLPPIQTGYEFPNDSIVSPLSPRDEPQLPLPIESDAETAAFMVTSECPVLNADEVQSLLAMPPATTTCPANTHTLTTASSMYLQQSFSTVQLNSPINTLTQVPYPFTPTVQGNVTFVPINYTPNVQQVPVVLYNQPVAQTFIQQPPSAGTIALTQYPSGNLPYSLRVSTSSGDMPQSVIISPPGKQTHVGYPTTDCVSYGVQQCNPIFYQQPLMVPLVPQQMRYNSTPVVSLGNTSTPIMHTPPAKPQTTFTYQHAAPSPVTPATSKPPLQDMPLPQNVELSKSQKKKNVENVADRKLASDQKLLLDQMIEFYSNKNNLSHDEKEMVRAIIADQIQNKCLPMPSLDNQQAPNSFATPKFDLSSAHPSSTSHPGPIRPHGPRTSESHRPAILHGQKRNHLSQGSSPHEVPMKRMRKTKRKEKHATRKFGIESTEKRWHHSDDQTFWSPLLNLYLRAAQAEHTTDEKLAKKWRDVFRMLNRHNIHLDVPWASKKGSKENRLPPPPPQSSKRPHLMFEITSEDGYHVKGPDLQDLVLNLLDAVQECRSNARLPPNSLCMSSVLTPHSFLGASHDAVRFLVEQLPGARHCPRYRAKYHKHREMPEEIVTHINPHGSARAEKYQGRSKPDMFSFLASKHRLPPSYDPTRTQNIDMLQNSTRRPTSMELPMAMRFRHLRTFAREAVGVYRSAIHGRGLYCKRDIEAGEMVMEYTGEVIRCFLTDHREKMYEKKGIGCYMFRMDDMYVVDATMMGSGARFINHSCEPSCYSRIVHIDGKKHIVIFALRKICRGEELTYDYKFPIEAEDQKIMCNCGAKTCRKYMN